MPAPHSARARSRAASAPLPDALSRLLARPDLRIAPHERSISFEDQLPGPFAVAPDGHISLGPACLARGERGASLLRHALELSWLLPRSPADPIIAGLAAARCAALFALIHGTAESQAGGGTRENWHADLAAPLAPPPARLALHWATLAALQPGAPMAALSEPAYAGLKKIWSLLGPAEALLQTGGDQRLRVDPATGLNFYGCSHRPRPWAVTFASSTASSSSERGFAAAEAARQRVTLAALAGTAEPALALEAAAIQAEIAADVGLLPPGGVILAASGTDCELIALALATSAPHPITNILVAPEETGSGVPLAATGCHFATDTARGAAVTKGERIAGFPPDTALVRVAARGPDGELLPLAAIEAACSAAAAAALADGRQVVLHLLDISKTGYIAPRPAALDTLCAAHPGRILVVVDACQGRLCPSRVTGYLARGWIVLLTGSKFLTGPPFAGAVLVPAAEAARLAGPMSQRFPQGCLPEGFLPQGLPKGLSDYSGRSEWPPQAATGALPATANYGLLLRWHAALAEQRALRQVGERRTAEILTRFGARVREAIAANPDLALLAATAPPRPDANWDAVQTIFSFITRPAAPLTPDDARRVYHWLNADLRTALPASLTAEQERLACLRCHIGQPVPLPAPGGGSMGVLRLSAGARLVSGEPSHHDLDEEARLLREIADALSVLAKISLILRFWDRLAAADPRPSF